MFLGTYWPRLDDKGRLVLPAKYRDALARGLILTKGQERSIVVWPTEAFEALAAAQDSTATADAERRAYERILFSSAFDEMPDRQGRVTIPPALREYAGLERDVVVIGRNATVEIWDAAAWQAYADSQDDAFSRLGGEVDTIAT
jgi:MraZ protein